MSNVLNYTEQGGSVTVIGGQLKLTSAGTITAAGTQASAIASLTDSTGGTANDTLADAVTVTAITDSTTGTADGTLADVSGSFVQATLNNNFADIAAKINTIVTDLTTSNNNVADLGAKVNAILAALRGVGIIAT